MKQAHPHTPKTQIQVTKMPMIYIEPKAFDDMHCIVSNVQEEVGWLGTVKRLEPKSEYTDYLIDEIFLLHQEVDFSVTTISEEGISLLADELLARPDGVEILNSIRFWGHSHPNATSGTAPSLKDEETFEELSRNCSDFFIRGIINKRGRFEFSVHLLRLGIVLLDIPWQVYRERDLSRMDKWKAEIKVKVKKKVYSYKNNDYAPSSKRYNSSTGKIEPVVGNPQFQEPVSDRQNFSDLFIEQGEEEWKQSDIFPNSRQRHLDNNESML